MQNGTRSRPRHQRRPWHPRTGRVELRGRLRWCHHALAGALLAFMWGGAAWAAVDAPRGVVGLWKGDDQWVRIERQDDSGALPNDHPAQLASAAIASALGALRIRIVDADSGTEMQRAVFTQEELGNLAPAVAEGLAKAGPRQDITFSTIGSRSRGAGSLIKDPSVNAGRVFYEDGKLNVIFGELQTNYRKKNIYGRMDEDFEARRQGTRTQANKLKLSLATLPGIALHASSDGSARNDWVTIDPAVAGSQTPAARQAIAPAPAAPPAPAVDAAPRPAPATIPGGPATGTAAADLEHRLRILKDLRDKGLITEEAYNAKVRELLSDL